MTTRSTIAALAAMAVLLAACGNEGQEQPGERMSAGGSVSAEGSTSTGQRIGEDMAAAREHAAAAGREAGASLEGAGRAVSEQGSELVRSGEAQARDMIASVQRYLAEKDLDSARGVLDKLDQIKDSLSDQLQARITALHDELAALSAGGGSG